MVVGEGLFGRELWWPSRRPNPGAIDQLLGADPRADHLAPPPNFRMIPESERRETSDEPQKIGGKIFGREGGGLAPITQSSQGLPWDFGSFIPNKMPANPSLFFGTQWEIEAKLPTYTKFIREKPRDYRNLDNNDVNIGLDCQRKK